MATFTATNTYAGLITDFVEFNTGLLTPLALSGNSATGFTLSDTSPVAGDYQIIFTGTGLGYTSGNFPTSGTITGAQIRIYNGTTFVTTSNWTDLSINAASVPGPLNSDVSLGLAFFGGNDSMNGADGFDDSIYGYAGNDTLNGNSGHDTLRGLEGDDIMNGGAGNDAIFAEYGFDVAHGDAGNDQIFVTSGSNGGTFDGGDGGETVGDTLIAWSSSINSIIDLSTCSVENFEQIEFNASISNHEAILLRLAGFQAQELPTNTVLTGSFFTDDALAILDINGSFNMSAWQIFSWNTNDTNDSIQLAGGTGNDTIHGHSTYATSIGGGQGDDTLYGGTGNDGFTGVNGGDGVDNMYGGDGNDRYGVFDAGDVIHEVDGEGTDHANVWANNYVLAANVETADLYGSAAVFTANASANVITGNALANTILGMDGADTIFGGDGEDVLIGGVGADELLGEGGNDAASYSTSASAVSVNLATGAASGGDAAGDTFDGIEDLHGSAFNDFLIGDGGINGLDGGAGNDFLNGGVGADGMEGGAGNDTFVVDNAGDETVENGGAGVDLVQSSITWTLGANLENLSLTGAGVINGTGNSAANVITGNNKVNILSGGAGNDTLNGGAGKDQLTGGSGNDKFVFNVAATAANVDRVHDFTHNKDTIQLDNAVFTKLGGNALNLAASKFWAGANAHDANDRIIYNAANGQLFYDANGSGAGQKFLIATLDAHLTLTASDFQVI
jgi:serralysin